MKRCLACGKKLSGNRYARRDHAPDYCSTTCEQGATAPETIEFSVPVDGKTYWNGEPCDVRRVRVIVGESLRPTWWCAELEGQERVVLEVQYGEPFYIEDDEQSWAKLTLGRGMWTSGHKSVPVAKVLEVLDDNDRAGA